MPNHNIRPVFLNLFRIRQPVTAVLSVLHRLTGLLMVFAVPVLIYLLGLSVQSPAGYERVVAILPGPYSKAAGVLLVWALAHHLLSGVRFLLIDVDVGVQRRTARFSAWAINLVGLGLALVFLGGIV